MYFLQRPAGRGAGAWEQARAVIKVLESRHSLLGVQTSEVAMREKQEPSEISCWRVMELQQSFLRESIQQVWQLKKSAQHKVRSTEAGIQDRIPEG